MIEDERLTIRAPPPLMRHEDSDMTDDQIRELVKAHTDEIKDKLADLTDKLAKLTELVVAGFNHLEGRIDKLERKLSIINDRLLSHEADIRELQEKN